MIQHVLAAFTGVFTAPMGYSIVAIAIIILGAIIDFCGGHV